MKSEKEDLSGQLNLFDSNMDFSAEDKPKQKKENLGLKGKIKDEQEALDKAVEEKSVKEPMQVHAKASKMHASLYRMYEEVNTKKTYVVAYIDYNKVYWKEEQNTPVLMLFPNAKMAVDAYMDKVYEYARGFVQVKGKLVLEDA